MFWGNLKCLVLVCVGEGVDRMVVDVCLGEVVYFVDEEEFVVFCW